MGWESLCVPHDTCQWFWNIKDRSEAHSLLYPHFQKWKNSTGDQHKSELVWSRNPSILETEARRPGIWSQSGLHNVFEINLNYTARPCQNKNKNISKIKTPKELSWPSIKPYTAGWQEIWKTTQLPSSHLEFTSAQRCSFQKWMYRKKKSQVSFFSESPAGVRAHSF